MASVIVAYWGARQTSVFAVDRVEVHGAPPDVAREVRAVVSQSLGSSLLSVDTGELEGKLRMLPSVIAASVDRAFPHTLVVKVAAERPVAIARRGDGAWLVTGSARVIGTTDPTAEPSLPRIWLPRQTAFAVGGKLPGAYAPAAKAMGALRDVHFPGHVRGVRVTGGELTLVLRSGREVAFGESTDVVLKLAAAGVVLPELDSSLRYLDVSVPERPVASTNPQPSG
jgi:cell division protein FtsQ